MRREKRFINLAINLLLRERLQVCFNNACASMSVIIIVTMRDVFIRRNEAIIISAFSCQRQWAIID